MIVTHFHQDHFTGFDYFPNARFVMQGAELEFGQGRSCVTRSLTSKFAQKFVQRGKKLEQEGRIEMIDGVLELYPGSKLLKAAGHTPGSQMVAAGKAVLCGDIAYTYKNIRDHIPVGWYYNLADTVIAPERALATAARPDLAFPNHDTEIMRGKPRGPNHLKKSEPRVREVITPRNLHRGDAVERSMLRPTTRSYRKI